MHPASVWLKRLGSLDRFPTLEQVLGGMRVHNRSKLFFCQVLFEESVELISGSLDG